MELIHHHFETLTSTNDWAKEQLFSLPRDTLTLVTADKQTRGRGQYGRKWISPEKENLYASFCFFIDENQQDPLTLTHVLALSVARVLQKKGIQSQIKWPNDLLVEGKKIAGILCETEHLPPYFGVVIGVGININMSDSKLSKIGQPATSLSKETGQKEAIAPILQNISAAFLEDLTLFINEGFTPFFPTFHKLLLPALRSHHIL